MQDVTVARLQSLSLKCNVLRESLSVDSQSVPCATLKRRGSWVISKYLWVPPSRQIGNGRFLAYIPS